MPEYREQIYLLACKNLRFVKIGFSACLAKRINDLTESYRMWSIIVSDDRSEPELTLLKSFDGSYKLEAFLHYKWRDFRVRREWFELRGELKIWILAVCENEQVLTDLMVEFEAAKPNTKKPQTYREFRAELAARIQREQAEAKLATHKAALVADLANMSLSQLKSVLHQRSLSAGSICDKCWGHGAHRVWCSRNRK